VQIAGGLALLLAGVVMGQKQMILMLKGNRATGKIVEYQMRYFNKAHGSSTSALMPVVEFENAGQVVRFEDWLGGHSTGGKDSVVPVLYLPANPAEAMIDRPTMNFIPWAPILAVGFLILLIGIAGLIKSRSRL
jgi:hypothetical protein